MEKAEQYSEWATVRDIYQKRRHVAIMILENLRTILLCAVCLLFTALFTSAPISSWPSSRLPWLITVWIVSLHTTSWFLKNAWGFCRNGKSVLDLHIVWVHCDVNCYIWVNSSILGILRAYHKKNPFTMLKFYCSWTHQTRFMK